MPFKGFGEVDTRKLEVTRRLITDLAQHKAKLDLDLLARREDLMERNEIAQHMSAFASELPKAKTNEDVSNLLGKWGGSLGRRVGTERFKEAFGTMKEMAAPKLTKPDMSTDAFEFSSRLAAQEWMNMSEAEKQKLYGGNPAKHQQDVLERVLGAAKQRQTDEAIFPDPKTGETYRRDPKSNAWMKHVGTQIGGRPVEGSGHWVEATGLNKLETAERVAQQRVKATKDSKGFKYSFPFMDEAGKDRMQTLGGRDPQDVYNQLKVSRDTISLIYDIPSLNADQRGWLSTLFGADRNVTWEQAKQRPDVWDQLSDAQKAPFLKVLMLNAQIKHFEDSYLKGVEPETETTKTTTAPSTSTEGKKLNLRKTAPSGG